MTRSRVIGITGGISTGKSTVTNILRDKGYIVVDADAISRKTLDVGTDAYNEVVSVFGKGMLNGDGSVDRIALGNLIFKDQKLREELNSITHPYILKQIRTELDHYKDREIVFLDMPLLFEIQSSLLEYGIKIDQIWLVYLDRETQMERLMKRDSIDFELAKCKIDSQMDIEEKRILSDRIIDNTGDRTSLNEQIETYLKKSHKN